MSIHHPAECLTCRAEQTEDDLAIDVAEMRRRIDRLRMLSVSRRLADVRDITGESA